MRILFVSRPTILTVPGGDTIQMQNTAKALLAFDVQADFYEGDSSVDFNTYDLIHFFNITRPDVIIKTINKLSVPYVVSPIFMDYSFYTEIKKPIIHYWLTKCFGIHGIEYFKSLGKFLLKKEQLSFAYLLSGQKRSIKKIIKKAGLLLPNSTSEYNRIFKNLGIDKAYHVVPNGIDTNIFNSLETEIQKIKGQVLCVANIEPRKNQLNLIRAVKNTSFRLIIIGKSAPNHQEYFRQCKNEANEQIRFIDFISQKELMKYYAQSEIHCLPSWFETCGLSSLEAGVSSCKIVATQKGDQKDYLKSFSEYCDPNSVLSIENALKNAEKQDFSDDFKNHILKNYTWEQAAKETFNAYKKALL
jgi:glycosyltransferase involved in cell wall biosynthesis